MDKQAIAEVTPQEAVALTGFVFYGDVDAVAPIVKAIKERLTKEGCTVFLYAAIWNAGRVAGIRSERAKRRSGQAVSIQ